MGKFVGPPLAIQYAIQEKMANLIAYFAPFISLRGPVLWN